MTSTSRSALASVFGAIVSLMGALVQLIGVVNKTISVADTAISDVQLRQDARSRLEGQSYRDRYLREKAAELAEATRSAEAYAEKSPAHKAHYEAALASLEAALSTEK